MGIHHYCYIGDGFVVYGPNVRELIETWNKIDDSDHIIHAKLSVVWDGYLTDGFIYFGVQNNTIYTPSYANFGAIDVSRYREGNRMAFAMILDETIDEMDIIGYNNHFKQLLDLYLSKLPERDDLDFDERQQMIEAVKTVKYLLTKNDNIIKYGKCLVNVYD